MAKVEREQIKKFEFNSKMLDVGPYSGLFLFRRKRPSLETQQINTKSALAGGIAPLTRDEMQLIDTIATLTVYVQPVDQYGKPIENDNWIDEIFDEEILYALHKEWLTYQASFYPQVKPQGEKQDEAAVQG